MQNSPTGAFRALSSFNYRIWITGTFVSNIGTWMQRVAQDWLVLTQLTHHDASALGLVMALQFLPQFLFLPWIGPAADRFDPRKMIMITQAVLGLLALVLGILTITGHIQLWHVYVFAFLFGSAAAVDAPVRQTFLADLVQEQHLSNAVALNSTSFNAARMIGPAIAGILIAKTGIGWAFVFNGVSFVAVLLSMAGLRGLAPHQSNKVQGKGDFIAGCRYVWQRGDLRINMLMLLIIGTFGLNFPIYISTMAVRIFHSDSQQFGLLSSIMAVGTISGALLAAQREKPAFGSMATSTMLFGVGCALAAISPGYWWFAACLVIIGIAALTFINTSNALMQLTVDRTMRGRVMALRVAVALGGTPIGAPITGWIADHLGPRWGLGVGATAGFLAAAMALIYVRLHSTSNQ